MPVYTLNCTGTGVSQGSMKTLNSFLFAAADNADLNTDITGVIDEEEGTVSLILPVDVDLDNLVASFTCSAESIEIGTTVQESGVTQNDFSLPVTYTLTAEDSTTKDYTVTTGYDIKIACFGGTETDYAQSIGLDAEPDPYITGAFQGTIDFDPSSGGGEVTSNGDYDVFVLKLQSSLDELRWAKSVGGTGWDRGNALAVTSAGHVYITGHFENTVDFDPDASGTSEETSNGDRDVFLFCLDAFGDFSWSLSYGGSSVYADIGVDLVEDSSGNCVVASQVCASVDFDPSAGTDIPDYYSEYDIALSGYSNGSGSYGNTIRGAGDAVELIYGFILDDLDNNYHTGRFDTDCDMDPTAAGTDTRTCNGVTDVYIARWNADETYGWRRTFGGTLADAGSTICCYGNNVYIAGHFSGSDVDFNQDGSPADVHSSNGSSDVFFTKLSLDNDYVFTKTWGGSGEDNPSCICALDDGRIILCGNFYGTVDFDPSSGVDSHSSSGFGDIFITCFDGSSQEYMWTRTFGGSGSDYLTDLVYDADSGYLFITGFFNDSVDFDPAAREQNFTSNGGSDIFVMRMDL